MQVVVNISVQLVKAVARVYKSKWSFLAVFAALFLGSVYTLARLDLLPEHPPVAPIVSLSASDATASTTEVAAIVESPVRIEIPVIGLSASIANPDSTNPETLDEYLLKGAVRYPTTAKLGEEGNMVIFGHSSYLPIVKNQAYKTFDGIQKLAAGDLIQVYSGTEVYTYTVRTVAKESALDAVIPLNVVGKVLTLSTCNSFGEKTDRFVVTADFLGSRVI